MRTYPNINELLPERLRKAIFPPVNPYMQTIIDSHRAMQRLGQQIGIPRLTDHPELKRFKND